MYKDAQLFEFNLLTILTFIVFGILIILTFFVFVFGLYSSNMYVKYISICYFILFGFLYLARDEIDLEFQKIVLQENCVGNIHVLTKLDIKFESNTFTRATLKLHKSLREVGINNITHERTKEYLKDYYYHALKIFDDEIKFNDRYNNKYGFKHNTGISAGDMLIDQNKYDTIVIGFDKTHVDEQKDPKSLCEHSITVENKKIIQSKHYNIVLIFIF